MDEERASLEPVALWGSRYRHADNMSEQRQQHIAVIPVLVGNHLDDAR